MNVCYLQGLTSLQSSQVCRAAVICVCEMFVKLRRSMEQDLEKIALPLIAKTGQILALMDTKHILLLQIQRGTFQICRRHQQVPARGLPLGAGRHGGEPEPRQGHRRHHRRGRAQPQKSHCQVEA